MYSDDLRSFILLLEQADQLARIQAEVDPCLELATIVNQVSKGEGMHRALFFEKVYGSALPVVANLFGTVERVAWALGTTDLMSVALRLSDDLHSSGRTSASAALEALCTKAAYQPVLDSHPVCRELDHSAKGLDLIPSIKAWPRDGGTFLTMAQVVTRHPDGGPINCGMYRMQRFGRYRAGLRCREGSGARRHMAAWHARGLSMPVAVALGGPPALIWAAGTPLPDGIDEVSFSSYLLGKRLVLSHCQTNNLQVPASSEIVIEGKVEPGATCAEGPFGNHTGAYDSDPLAPLLSILTVHSRRKAVYPWTLVGPPPMENISFARATEQLFLPLVKFDVPAVRQVYMPPEAIMHHVALITVNRDDKSSLADIAQALWSTLLFRRARLLIIGADDHNPHDTSAVFWKTLNRIDWGRDLLVIDGRLAVDARRIPEGGPVMSDPAVLAKVLRRWHEYRIVPEF